MSALGQLLDSLWTDYSTLNPQARAIHSLLESRGEKIVNDHIALRTFRDDRVGLDALARPFVEEGYEPRGEYHFEEKKLFARHFEHPSGEKPRVFISELLVDAFDPEFQKIVHDLIDQTPRELPGKANFPVSGRPWKTTWSQYETLRKTSEYGAWMSAFGFRANHFTVLVNALRGFKTLAELNTFLKQNGFALNTTGGEIKGSPGVFLEQSSTLADRAKVEFGGEVHEIPACYYEFARRYPLPDGTLYSGFVEKSADKIFESTNLQ